jgi:hypothetical protein
LELSGSLFQVVKTERITPGGIREKENYSEEPSTWRCTEEQAKDLKAHPAQRWGSQEGSIILGNQKVSIRKRRVRNPISRQEIALETYARFQDPSVFDQHVFQEGIKHVSQRDYEKGLPKIAASFGMSRSSVSRSWLRSTKKQMERLLNRRLNALRIVAVFIDGKRFSKLGVVVALGVGEDGNKHVLGIYQSSTENSTACRELLDDLERRGLPEQGLLFCVDGGSGLNKALNDKYQIHDPKKPPRLPSALFLP